MRPKAVVVLLSLSPILALLPAQIVTSSAIDFLKSRHDATGGAFLASYGAAVPGVPANAGFTYDNALGALALLHYGDSGTTAAHTNARLRAESILIHLALNWQMADGGLHDAHDGQGAPLSGNRGAGANAWYVVAALRMAEAGTTSLATETILRQSALAALGWIDSLSGPAPAVGPQAVGYRLGNFASGACQVGGVFDVMSTENQTAVFAAAMLAFETTGDPTWLTMGRNARAFIEAALLPSGLASIGTNCGSLAFDGTTLPADVYFLPIICGQNDLRGAGPGGPRWSSSFAAVNGFATASATAAGTTHTGYAFANAPLGIHPETTAQAILAKTIAGDTSSPTPAIMQAALLAAQQDAIGATPGAPGGEGVVTAFTSLGNALPTTFGWSYYPVPGVAATAWSYFAATLTNPYWFAPATDQVVWYGQDRLATSWSPSSPVAGQPTTVQVSAGSSGAPCWLALNPTGSTPTALNAGALGGLVLHASGPLFAPDPTLVPLGNLDVSGALTWNLLPPAGLAGVGFDLQFATLAGTRVREISEGVSIVLN